MSELEPQSQSADPIMSLHKMSTTAGVATQDYVAINSFAVAAAVLGLATSLVFVGILFLAVGVLALACGGWALWKIHTSNGTQGGKGLAWLGIVLALAFSAAVVSAHVRQQRAESAEANQINDLIKQIGQDIIAGRYAAVYAVLDPEFRSKLTLEQFSLAWTNQQSPDHFGRLTEMYGNGCVQFAPATGDSGLMAYTAAVLHFQNYRDRRLTMSFQKSRDGVWRVSAMAEMFDFRRPRQRATQPAS